MTRKQIIIAGCIVTALLAVAVLAAGFAAIWTEGRTSDRWGSTAALAVAPLIAVAFLTAAYADVTDES